MLNKSTCVWFAALCILISACGKQADGGADKSAIEDSYTSALGYRIQTITLNALNFHYVEAGKGDLILFLHGFPYFGESWDKLLKPLSTRYHVVAPDNRGYGYTQKPSEISDYRIDKLVEDVKALILALSPDNKAIIVGHDWGGVLAWSTAQQYPHLIKKLIVINAPPYNVFLKMLSENESQRKASAYVGKLTGWFSKILFAIRGPELIWSGTERLYTEKHVGDKFKQAFLDSWAQPGAAEAAINWYKANIPDFDNITEQTYWPSKAANVAVPSLLIWSSRDKAFTQDTLNAIPDYVDDLTMRVIDTSSHTPFIDHTSTVLTYINEFLVNKPN